ncbi:hypothetical protein KSS87_000641 [Heliosperma pusillum]|nr:hypothetical protein KSS87_000641 [Heliosperma pusillum]
MPLYRISVAMRMFLIFFYKLNYLDELVFHFYLFSIICV